MGRPSWACNTKWSFLLEWKAKYLIARKEKKLKQFWPAFFAVYALLWPKPGLQEIIQSTHEDTALDEDEDQEEMPPELHTLAGSECASEDVDKPVAPKKKIPLTLERVRSCAFDRLLHSLINIQRL